MSKQPHDNTLDLMDTTHATEENAVNGHDVDTDTETDTGTDTDMGDIPLTDAPVPVAAPTIAWVETASENELRSLILQTADLEEKVVDVPEWKIRVLVRALTGKERTTLVKDCMQRDGTMDVAKLYPSLVVMSARHPFTHRPIFKATDRDMLLNKSGSVLDRLALVAAQLSGLSQNAAVDAAKN